MAAIDTQVVEISKLAQSEHEITALQHHLREITEGPAFKTSQRSGQFLKYIVDQSIAGHFESLKERLIGVQLFGRSHSYDTGEDAIVRVTASEVRRRLLQHYGTSTAPSEYRVSLPLGSYVPLITRTLPPEAVPIETSNGNGAHRLQHDAEAAGETTASASSAAHEASEPPSLESVEPLKASAKQTGRRWLFVAASVLILNTGLWFFLRAPSVQPALSPLSYLPWSALFHSTNPTVVITSDPNIAEIQGFTGSQISLSDYANHNYLAGPNKLTPEQERFCRVVLRGDKAASVDTPIAVSAAELAQSVSRKVEVRGARNIELPDLKMDTNFILLGSPRSDPWSGLFSDQLDFKFAYDKATGKEFIVNEHPRPTEQANYVATAPGWATGQSYAILALLQNPDSNGRILLLAGADAEGTEAAGKLVTHLPRLSQALDQCGLLHARPATNFEMLLRLNTMAGSPGNVDLIACHILRSAVP
jgi:hypothetical protein